MSTRGVSGWVKGVPRHAGGAPASDSRREFLRLAGLGGLALAVGPGGVMDAVAAGKSGPWEPHAYVRIGEDGSVTITCHRSEMGQGIRTTMAMIIADEMEADWSRCRVEQAEGDHDRYGSQVTDNSCSISSFLLKYRQTGATVRTLLASAAAAQWGVPVSEVRAEQHTLIHASSGKRIDYAAVVQKARELPVPAADTLRLKTPAERRWDGKGVTSVDLVPMTTGSAVFGADMRLPGMRFAVIERPPTWGAKLAKFDDSTALAVPGVERVLRIPESPLPGAYLPLGGVAVLARNTWAALRGRDALQIEWTAGPHEDYDSQQYRSALTGSVAAPGKPARDTGNTAEALAAAAQRVQADYYAPHLAHAQMEPPVAMAQVVDGRVEAWAPVQSPMDARNTLAEYLGIDVSKVRVNVTLLGGGFGRKSKSDFVCEAAWLARETGSPVMVQWSREDDLRNSYYHSVSAQRLEAGLDANGKVTAWLHRSAFPSIGATFSPDVPGPGPEELLNGASDIVFDIPNIRIEACPAVAHTRIGWYRSVYAIYHGFAIGSFVDELAHAAGRDPAEFLLALIGGDRVQDLREAGLLAPPANYYNARWEDHPIDTARARGVVKRAMDAGNWGAPLPRGRGRGIAMHRSFMSYVATVVEVEVQDDGTVLVPRATVALDAGYIANPDRARAQMEGAVVMAMSNTLQSSITFAGGRVEQSNYHDYAVARMPGSPLAVDVQLLDSGAVVGGVGEPGVPPSGAALGNAIFAATGIRIRDLPVGRQLAGWRQRAGA